MMSSTASTSAWPEPRMLNATEHQKAIERTGHIALQCHCSSGRCRSNGTCVASGKSAACLFYRDTGKTMCLEEEHVHMTCPRHSSHANGHLVFCCNNYDLCNMHFDTTVDPPPQDTTLLPVVGGLLAALCIVLACVFRCIVIPRFFPHLFKRNCFRRRRSSCRSVGDATLTDLNPSMGQVERSIESGRVGRSLEAVTLVKQIRRECKIGQGKYGQVWKGQVRCDVRAIKYFRTLDEHSWRREKHVYTTAMLPHTNVLAFYGSDIGAVGGNEPEMILVTEYHPFGSLYDCFNTRRFDEDGLTLRQAVTMITSGLAGLNHLHTAIHGSTDKPGIAHRDLKSKNILVKNDKTLCIADFGLAVLQIGTIPNKFNDIGKACSGSSGIGDTATTTTSVSQSGGRLDIYKENPRVGTKRYMAPELLADSVHHNNFNFQSYKMADIYSMAHIMWEIMTQCNLSGQPKDVEPYKIPYEGEVQADPSFAQMHDLVFVRGVRPRFPASWESVDDASVSAVLSEIRRLISESWATNPHARLSSMRLMKNFSKMKRQVEQEEPVIPEEDLPIVPHIPRGHDDIPVQPDVPANVADERRDTRTSGFVEGQPSVSSDADATVPLLNGGVNLRV